MNFVECVSLLGSCIAVAIAFATLQQNRNIIEETNRAYIIVFVEKIRSQSPPAIVIKNCGKTGGTLLSVLFNPPINFLNTQLYYEHDPLSDYKNIFIAPGQSLRTLFPFGDLKQKIFTIETKYESNGKQYIENYIINTNYIDTYLESNTEIHSFKQGLAEINKSIRELSDKQS